MTFNRDYINVGIVGAGTVGGGTIRVLAENADVIATRALPVKIKWLAEKDLQRGQAVLDELGLKDTKLTGNWRDLVEDPDNDIVVELIGGTGLAFDVIAAALSAGKSACTANKDLMATRGGELLAIAAEHHADLFFEAAVAGGIPIITSLKENLTANRFNEVMGIVNGTTNFILTKMSESGADFASTLKEAQDLGYAEADPTADVEGYDARRKLVLSANVAFGVSVSEGEIPCFGISSVTAKDIAAFKRMGRVCKLIAHAEYNDGSCAACVEPMLFPADGQMAHINGPDNIICLNAERVGLQTFAGAGAGGYPTASNVLADCLEIRGGCSAFYTAARTPVSVDNGALKQRYYVRIGDEAEIRQLSVGEAHKTAGEYKKVNQPFFMAAIPEE